MGGALRWIGGGLLALALVTCAAPRLGHVTEAMEHIHQAIDRGKQGDANGLAEQAGVALRYALLARRIRTADKHLEQGIGHLKSAIVHARYGRTEEGVMDAERALRKFADTN